MDRQEAKLIASLLAYVITQVLPADGDPESPSDQARHAAILLAHEANRKGAAISPNDVAHCWRVRARPLLEVLNAAE